MPYTNLLRYLTSAKIDPAVAAKATAPPTALPVAIPATLDEF